MLRKFIIAAASEDLRGRYEIADILHECVRLSVAQMPNKDMAVPNLQLKLKQLELKLIGLDQKYTTLFAKLEKQMGIGDNIQTDTQPELTQEQILDAVTPDGSTTPQFDINGGADIKVNL